MCIRSPWKANLQSLAARVCGGMKRGNGLPFTIVAIVSPVLFSMVAATAVAAPPSAKQAFRKDVKPILKQFCFDCHGDGADEGGLELESLNIGEVKKWHVVWSNVKHELMPPADVDRPSPAQRQSILKWIERYVMQLDPENPDPGKVTIRRLNREEYRWTINDLLGVYFDPSAHFPPEDTGYGFDTVSDTQSVAPLLTEKYIKAAHDIAEEAIPNPMPADLEERPWSYRRLLSDGPVPDDKTKRDAYRREIVRRLADRAFRRPAAGASVDRIVKLAADPDDGTEAGFEESIRTAITMILVSPRFLFRAEGEAPEDSQRAAVTKDNQSKAKKAVALDDFALASRLSYFLWSTSPDDELRQLAEQGKLREQIRPQIDRLVEAAQADRFYENFVGQWLRVRDVQTWDIDLKTAENLHWRKADEIFNWDVRHAMRDETYEFFEHLVHEKRSLRELLTADYTFVNDRLAKFYDLPAVEGKHMRKVDLPADSHRRGILSHGSFLLVTSNPTQTSPVKRGVFVLDNFLGTPAPPAPPTVPELAAKTADDGSERTMRERMAIHRSEPLCASCHSRMDPLGLAFESFSLIGRHRTEDEGQPIDTSGTLLTGESFRDARDLAEVLANQRRADFYRCVTEKMLTYGLGRGMEYYDIPAVDKIVQALEENDGNARTLIYEIVESVPFQMRRRGAK